MTKREDQQRALDRHYQTCAELVKLCGGTRDARKASRLLWDAEKAAHHAAEQYCNGEIDSEAWDRVKDETRAKVIDALGSLPPGFFVNGDPRGYALKLEADSVPIDMHRDWGGYQILSPEL